MRLWAYGSAVWSMGGRRRENCDSIMLPAIRVRGGGRIKNSRGSSRGDSDRERPFCRGLTGERAEVRKYLVSRSGGRCWRLQRIRRSGELTDVTAIPSSRNVIGRLPQLVREIMAGGSPLRS